MPKVTSTALRLASSSIRETLGVVDPAEIDVTLDASGFAFGDQWGSFYAADLLKRLKKSERRCQKLIFMPQAFGTFNDPGLAALCGELISRASLVCARDALSLGELQRVVDSPVLRHYPDFTISVSPVPPPASGKRLPEQFCAVVPNFRMIDKGEGAEVYLGFLRKSIAALRANGMEVLFMLHDHSDDQRVVDLLGERIQTFSHPDPRVLKWVLGRARLVIGSRFHALVSSLSCGVPCIIAGWSHKYPELAEDFDVADFLIKDLRDEARLEKIIATLANAEQRDLCSGRILKAKRRLEKKVEKMWEEVEAVIAEARCR